MLPTVIELEGLLENDTLKLFNKSVQYINELPKDYDFIIIHGDCLDDDPDVQDYVNRIMNNEFYILYYYNGANLFLAKTKLRQNIYRIGGSKGNAYYISPEDEIIEIGGDDNIYINAALPIDEYFWDKLPCIITYPDGFNSVMNSHVKLTSCFKVSSIGSDNNVLYYLEKKGLITKAARK